MGAVSLKGLHKRFGDTHVIRGVDLDVHDGEFMVFVGPSGCGKSTLLRMIAGLEGIDQGELHIGGQRANELHPADRGAAMVFQSYALYPHMTVAENMGFALRMAGVPRRQRDEQVAQAAEVLRIGALLQRTPRELSGGQRQRVAIGRAIVRKPSVFLFDEPLSNLDAALRVDMRIELARLHRELGTTMIYVTHDQTEAMTLGHRIAVFDRGRIEQLGAPLDLYHRPASEFVAAFLGTPRINLVARPGDGQGAAANAWWTALAAPAGAVKAGLRPEHLHLGPADTPARAQVELVEQLGDSSIAHLRVDGVESPVVARLGATDTVPQRGATVGLRPEPGRTLGFDVDGRRLA